MRVFASCKITRRVVDEPTYETNSVLTDAQSEIEPKGNCKTRRIVTQLVSLRKAESIWVRSWSHEASVPSFVLGWPFRLVFSPSESAV